MEKKSKETARISPPLPHARAHDGTVVIHARHAALTRRTVLASQRASAVARVAEPADREEHAPAHIHPHTRRSFPSQLVVWFQVSHRQLPVRYIHTHGLD